MYLTGFVALFSCYHLTKIKTFCIIKVQKEINRLISEKGFNLCNTYQSILQFQFVFYTIYFYLYEQRTILFRFP